MKSRSFGFSHGLALTALFAVGCGGSGSADDPALGGSPAPTPDAEVTGGDTPAPGGAPAPGGDAPAPAIEERTRPRRPWGRIVFSAGDRTRRARPT